MKIIATGGRDFTDKTEVHRLLAMFNPDQLVVGDCPTGVDFYAREWGDRNVGHPLYTHTKVYRANWADHGLSAGPIRNRRMTLENKDAALLLAFPGGTGTENCVKNAHVAGILVLRVEP
jgi:hypothetical protein